VGWVEQTVSLVGLRPLVRMRWRSAAFPVDGGDPVESRAGRSDQAAAIELTEVETRVDLVARPSHRVPVEERVADRRPQVVGQIVADRAATLGRPTELGRRKRVPVLIAGRTVERRLLAGLQG
jgi:hypothetical protein